MNVLLSLVRSNQWTAQKIGLGLITFVLLFTQPCPDSTPCPIIKSSIWCLQCRESGINLGVNYQDSGLWWALHQIIGLPYSITSHWWVSILNRICYSYMKRWNFYFTQLKLITSSDKCFLFLWNIVWVFGNLLSHTKHWLMGPLQLNLPPSLAQTSSYATGCN